MAQNISRLLVSSAELVVKSKAGSQKLLSEMQPGRVITARVLGLENPREAVLLIQGQKVAVKTYTPLRIGETITVKVQSTGKEMQLKIMADNSQSSATPAKTPPIPFHQETYRRIYDLLNSLEGSQNKPRPVGIQGPALKKLIFAMALKSEAPDREFLGRIIREGGFAWEHKLRRLLMTDNPPDQNQVKEMVANDLKALLLEGLQHESAGPSDVKGAIRVFIDQMEDLQLFNKQALEETGKFFFPFPMLLEGEWRLGQLLIHIGERDEVSKRPQQGVVRVALLLELSHLGELGADFSIFEKTVNGFFETADGSVCDLINAGIPELKSNLAAHGFKAEFMHCRLAVPGSSMEPSLLERVYAGDGMLNLIV